ncbi:MAG TPA: hypothetical protein VIV54_06000 [Burkholderiales bacterium]
MIAERHGGGCSCCPGLGEVAIEEVERRVTAWLREREEFEGSFTAVLRRCITARSDVPAGFFDQVDEALTELERIQSGVPA